MRCCILLLLQFLVFLWMFLLDGGAAFGPEIDAAIPKPRNPWFLWGPLRLRRLCFLCEYNCWGPGLQYTSRRFPGLLLHHNGRPGLLLLHHDHLMLRLLLLGDNGDMLRRTLRQQDWLLMGLLQH